MANPFESFAFRQAASKPYSNRSKQLPIARGNKCVSGDTTTASAPPVTPARRRRQSPLPSDVTEQQQAATVTSSSRVTTRSSNRTESPNSALTHPAKKKRKAYASLTGPPKGLGPKLGTAPLRLILVGHNPSEHAYHTGHFYSNPSNRMWPILISTGIAPTGTTGPEADDEMPSSVGVGFVDVGSGQPGTDSSLFSSHDFQNWRGGFYDRLRQHVAVASHCIGCTCGMCGAPVLVAFTGKRQFLELLNINAAGQLRKGKNKVVSSSVQLGKQPAETLPPGWPLPMDRTEVWVLTSTSGAAPMSNADRERPYKQLAKRLAETPWPRSDVVLRCSK